MDVTHVKIAGYTGRDRIAVDKYVAKLAEEGIPPPDRIPSIFSVGRDRVVQHPVIDVTGAETCGEVEFVLLIMENEWYVTVGSDHTDRALERSSIAQSKQAVPKPVAAEAWRWSDVAAHWDQVVLESEVGEDHRPYQRTSVDYFLRPEDLVKEAGAETGSVVFGGTVSSIQGGFSFDPTFHGRIVDPVLGRTIEFGYRSEILQGF